MMSENENEYKFPRYKQIQKYLEDKIQDYNNQNDAFKVRIEGDHIYVTVYKYDQWKNDPSFIPEPGDFENL